MKFLNSEITVLIILLIFTIGIVSAVNPAEFELPNGFELVDDITYFYPKMRPIIKKALKKMNINLG